MTKSTTILTNTSTLSRAADAMLKRGRLSKNAILNDLAAAIAGPGHDWGFLKSAPEGRYTQPGLDDAPKVTDTASDIWCVTYDERDDWSRATLHFPSKEDALEYLAHDQWWEHPHHTFNEVMHALRTTGEYYFSDREDPEDSDERPYAIHLFKPELLTKKHRPHYGVVGRPHILLCPGEYFMEVDGQIDFLLFPDLKYLEAYKQTEEGQRILQKEGAKTGMVDDFRFAAEFTPQAWINDSAIAVDPQGDTEWQIYPRELDPKFTDTDYLLTSVNAPDWVRDWSGPFSIRVTVEPRS